MLLEPEERERRRLEERAAWTVERIRGAGILTTVHILGGVQPFCLRFFRLDVSGTRSKRFMNYDLKLPHCSNGAQSRTDVISMQTVSYVQEVKCIGS